MVQPKSTTRLHSRVTTGVPADSHDEVLLGVPVEAEAVRPRREVDASTSPVVLLVVGVRARTNGANAEVSEALGQWVVIAHDEVHRPTLLKRRERRSRCCKGQGCGSQAERNAGEGNHGSDEAVIVADLADQTRATISIADLNHKKPIA